MMTTPKSPAQFDPAVLLQAMPNRPGVYRMLDEKGSVLYVGKARNLKRRLASYFRSRVDSPKTRALVDRIANVEVTVTRNETEALVLENQLIKAHQPRYNLLLRDDKGYLYLCFSPHPFPRIFFHRGSQRSVGRCFGPYSSGTAVRESITILQKIFKLRSCEDSVFSHRTRPCLEHAIGRCTAPCVGGVAQDAYARTLRHAVLFLEGKNTQVLEELVGRMEEAARILDFEQAAVHRDQIVHLRQIQDQQLVQGGEGTELDVVACVVRSRVACVVVFCLRGGYHRGHKSHFPRMPTEAADLEPSTVLAAFLPQYYLQREDMPQAIWINHTIPGAEILQNALSEAKGKQVSLIVTQTSLVTMATTNAEQAISLHLATLSHFASHFQAVEAALSLASPLHRVECFDVSHTQGEATTVSCVVFGRRGPILSEYRHFNVEGIAPGDDGAALYNAMTRRYQNTQQAPDLCFVDGGKTQLAQAERVLAEQGICGVTLVGIAKDPNRTPGRETLFLSGQQAPLQLPPDSPALLLIQQIRDEAHRFALKGHRQRRAKARRRSVLEDVPGIGAARRRKILNHFGGLPAVLGAGVEDLARTPGISRALAEHIHHALHPR